MNTLIEIFISFFKIGAFTFGGGYAMIPLIEKEIVDTRQWIVKEDFLDIVVISQSFPGALAVNVATFVGYKVKGFKGALCALLGVVLPSFFIILTIASFLMQFRNNHYVDNIFKGIKAAVPVLVLTAVISLSKGISKNLLNFSIIAIAVLAVAFLKVHPIVIIICSGIFGFFYYRKKVK